MSGIPHHRRGQVRVRCFAILTMAAMVSTALAADAIVGRHPDSVVRARVVELVNAARARGRMCGDEHFAAAPPLQAVRPLDEAAASLAHDMARRKYFDHRAADGSQPRERVLRAGYQSKLTGENIAFGPTSAEEVVAGWLGSPGHCANIMDTRFQHIGVGLATGKKRGHIYWVQDFGAPLRRNP
ncbi:MAG: CAP domain-containing protein [Pseudomonadota bacterium]